MSKEIILTPVRTTNTESSSMISPNTQTLYAPRAYINHPDEYGLISYSDLGYFTYTKEEIDNKDSEVLRQAKEYSDNNSSGSLDSAKAYSDNNLEIAKQYSDNNLETAKQHSDNNLEIAKNYTDNELLNYYTKAEVDNKDESVLNSAKNYTYSKEEIDAKDTALSVKIEAVEDKSDGRLKALSFEDNDQIIAWIDGTYTYVDGVTGETITPADVTIGQNIYNKNLVQNDYWVSRLPITSIDDLAILVTDKNTLNATDIKFNPANENKLSSTDVQGAIDELATKLQLFRENMSDRVLALDASVNNLLESDVTKNDQIISLQNRVSSLEQNSVDYLEQNSVLFTIATDKWQDLADKSPYKYSATIDCNYSITTTGEPVYELINNNPVNFANYGFALNEVSLETTPKSFTFYAMEKPTESVNLRVLITANSVELIAQEGGAV